MNSRAACSNAGGGVWGRPLWVMNAGEAKQRFLPTNNITLSARRDRFTKSCVNGAGKSFLLLSRYALRGSLCGTRRVCTDRQKGQSTLIRLLLLSTNEKASGTFDAQSFSVFNPCRSSMALQSFTFNLQKSVLKLRILLLRVKSAALLTSVQRTNSSSRLRTCGRNTISNSPQYLVSSSRFFLNIGVQGVQTRLKRNVRFESK